MRILFFILLLNAVILSSSCKNSTKEPQSSSAGKPDSLAKTNAADDSSLQYLTQASAQLLPEWKQSFKDFLADSFRFTQRTSYSDKELQDTAGMKEFMDLYGPSLVFTADSSRFIDLFSAGISLERQGKKLIAIADADMAISLCNLKNGQWKQIAFFGPSAGIEESAWVSDTVFVLAGTIHNDDGIPEAFILVGNTQQQKLSWFESNIIRPASVEYNASGLKKLKIDEWE